MHQTIWTRNVVFFVLALNSLLADVHAVYVVTDIPMRLHSKSNIAACTCIHTVLD